MVQGRQIALGRNEDKRLEVFFTTMEDEIYHAWQVAINRNWLNPVPIGNGDQARRLAVSQNVDQELVVIYRGNDDHLYFNRQITKNGNWNGETLISGDDYCLEVSASQLSNQQLTIFYIGTDGYLYHNFQTDTDNWAGERRFSDYSKQVALAQYPNGTLEVFHIFTRNSFVFHSYQLDNFNNWSEYDDIAGPAVQVVAAPNKAGKMEIFLIGTDQNIYRSWQVPNVAANTWHDAIPLGGKAIQLAIGTNQDGRLELFYIGTDNRLYHNWQLSNGQLAGGDWQWHGEVALGGAAKQITVGSNEDGRLELFYIGTNDVIYHNWQTEPNGNWYGEYGF